MLSESQNGGSNASQPDNGGSSVQIKSSKFDVPQKRAAIGAKQDLDDEEYEFLKTAMQYNLPLVMQQRNPKKGASRLRYEKYKHGRTIRDLVKLGAKMDDVKWDYSRGYIDFSPTAASNATLAKLVEDDRCRPKKEKGKIKLSWPLGSKCYCGKRSEQQCPSGGIRPSNHSGV